MHYHSRALALDFYFASFSVLRTYRPIRATYLANARPVSTRFPERRVAGGRAHCASNAIPSQGGETTRNSNRMAKDHE